MEAVQDLSSLQGQKVVDARGHLLPGPDPGRQEGHGRRQGRARSWKSSRPTPAQKDLPAWAKKLGHEYLGFVEEPGYMRLFVKKLK